MTWNSVRYAPQPWVRWHQTALPRWATCMDLDSVEACNDCGRALLLVEMKHSAAPDMTAFQQRVLIGMSAQLYCPAFEVRYLLTPDPDDPWSPDEHLADRLRLRDLNDPHGRWINSTLAEYAELIEDTHAAHHAGRCTRAAK